MSDKIQLTDVFLKNVKPPERGQTDIWDAKIAGFGVRVSHTGTRTFVMVYRFQGDWRRDTLGQYPDVKLADARGKAEKARGDLRDGIDPRGKRKTSRPAPKAESFVTVVDAFIVGYVARNNRASTAAETERLLRSVFVPVWERRALGEIKKADILHVIDGIMARGKPSSARHAFAAIRKFFNWCVERGHLDDSPCRTIKPPVKANSRDRVLSDAELALIWKAAEGQGWPFGRIVQLLMLTGQRRGEVVGLRWEELDLDAAVWTIPGSRTKNHKQHLVPLSPTVVAILKALPRMEGSEFAFPARGMTGAGVFRLLQGQARARCRHRYGAQERSRRGRPVGRRHQASRLDAARSPAHGCDRHGACRRCAARGRAHPQPRLRHVRWRRRRLQSLPVRRRDAGSIGAMGEACRQLEDSGYGT